MLAGVAEPVVPLLPPPLPPAPAPAPAPVAVVVAVGTSAWSLRRSLRLQPRATAQLQPRVKHERLTKPAARVISAAIHGKHMVDAKAPAAAPARRTPATSATRPPRTPSKSSSSSGRSPATQPARGGLPPPKPTGTAKTGPKTKLRADSEPDCDGLAVGGPPASSGTGGGSRAKALGPVGPGREGQAHPGSGWGAPAAKRHRKAAVHRASGPGGGGVSGHGRGGQQLPGSPAPAKPPSLTKGAWLVGWMAEVRDLRADIRYTIPGDVDDATAAVAMALHSTRTWWVTA